jgi:hypothetical protein
MENLKVESVHISQITVGDTIIHDGEMRTVNANNIKNDSFLGRSIFGDSYNLGTKKVIKVMIENKQK